MVIRFRESVFELIRERSQSSHLIFRRVLDLNRLTQLSLQFDVFFRGILKRLLHTFVVSLRLLQLLLRLLDVL